MRRRYFKKRIFIDYNYININPKTIWLTRENNYNCVVNVLSNTQWNVK